MHLGVRCILLFLPEEIQLCVLKQCMNMVKKYLGSSLCTVTYREKQKQVIQLVLTQLTFIVS